MHKKNNIFYSYMVFTHKIKCDIIIYNIISKKLQSE